MEEEELKILCSQFEKEAMQTQIKAWKQQSTMLRDVCKSFWEENGSVFSNFWFDAEDTIRLALAAMANEDLPPLCVGPLLEITCPELINTEELIRVEQSDAAEKSSKLVTLMAQVCRGEENKQEAIRERLSSNGLEGQQNKVVDTLLVVRSCMLLQYMTAIGLVWQQLVTEGIEG